MFRVASPSSLVFVVPRFTQKNFCQGESCVKQPRRLARLPQWTLRHWSLATSCLNICRCVPQQPVYFLCFHLSHFDVAQPAHLRTTRKPGSGRFAAQQFVRQPISRHPFDIVRTRCIYQRIAICLSLQVQL